MSIRKTKHGYRVTNLQDLFFYTLYNVDSYWYVGRVVDRIATKINNKLGIDIKNYSIKLRGSELKHFLYSHFHELSSGQRSIHFDDIEELPKMINMYSYVLPGNKKDTLVFERRYAKNTFQLVVEINHAEKVLYGLSFRIKT